MIDGARVMAYVESNSVDQFGNAPHEECFLSVVL